MKQTRLRIIRHVYVDINPIETGLIFGSINRTSSDYRLPMKKTKGLNFAIGFCELMDYWKRPTLKRIDVCLPGPDILDRSVSSPCQGCSQLNCLSINRDHELPGLLVARDRDVKALVIKHTTQTELDRRVGQCPSAAEGALGLSRDACVEAAPDGFYVFGQN